MPDESAAPQKSPELLSLEATRASLQASIAAREKAQEHASADFRAVTGNERSRLAEVEARIKQIDPSATPLAAKPR